MQDKICYKKPFLKDVIIRVDYGIHVEAFRRSLPEKVAAAALRRFPIFEPQKGQHREITLVGSNVATKTHELIKWIYHGKNREKNLTVDAASLCIINHSYESYESFYQDFEQVLGPLAEHQKGMLFSRFGLRYINVLDIPADDDPLNWADYIIPAMLGTINDQRNNGLLSRAFQIVEFNNDGLMVKFQFGIANPDYPAPVKRKQFVLDIDAYCNGALNYNEILDHATEAHALIQKFFERSITDKTRELMGKI